MSCLRWQWAGVSVLLLMAVGLACGKSKPPAREPAAERSKGFSKDDQARCEYKGREDRDVSESTAPGAFQPNVRRVYQIVGEGADKHKVMICREVDTNLDGVKDVVRIFNEKGEPIREEADTNYDGKVDSWGTYVGGRLASQDVDTNGDGKPDVWKHYLNGKLSRVQRDRNFDGKPDMWEIYNHGQLERIGVDVDFDEHVDRWDRDETASRATATRDTESDAGTGDAGPATSGDGGADASKAAASDGGPSKKEPAKKEPAKKEPAKKDTAKKPPSAGD